MKYKVAELTGVWLDVAVAKAEGLPKPGSMVKHWVPGLAGGRIDASFYQPGPAAYSTDWRVGGPIIYRDQISVISPDVLGPPHTEWRAEIMAILLAGLGEHAVMFGSTPLIAAMRAKVASKFGDEVEL